MTHGLQTLTYTCGLFCFLKGRKTVFTLRLNTSSVRLLIKNEINRKQLGKSKYFQAMLSCLEQNLKQRTEGNLKSLWPSIYRFCNARPFSEELSDLKVLNFQKKNNNLLTELAKLFLLIFF